MAEVGGGRDGGGRSGGGGGGGRGRGGGQGGQGRGGGSRGRGDRDRDQQFGGMEEMDMVEDVVNIKPVSKVTKGGRDRRFNAVVVVGDRKGRVGVALGKAREVPEAIRKASQRSRRDMVRVPVDEGTIPHQVVGRSGGGKVLLRPAAQGTGVIACKAVRAVLQAAGIQNVLTKSLGSTNEHNVAMATLDGLLQLRTRKEIEAVRGRRDDSA